MTFRRACRASTASTVEIRNEGPRSGSSYPRNEDHMGSDIETVVAYVVRLRLEDTRALQPSYAKPATTPLPTNLRLSRKNSPTSALEGNHMKSVPYAPAVGSLMYAMVATRPDIAHAVGIISRFMHNPDRAHWNAVKHIFRYLVGTQDYGIAFVPDEPSSLVGYTDSDYRGCINSRKSTFGYPSRGGRNFKIVRLCLLRKRIT